MRFTLRRAGIAVGVLALSLAMGGTGAMADPNLNHQGGALGGGFLPDTNDIVGTGSDTSMYVMTTAAWAHANSNPANGRRLASFNACVPGSEIPLPPDCGSDQIQIRPTVSITRPNGSGAGITTLANNLNVDFARSSSGPSATNPVHGPLSFVAVLRDGLSYIFDDTAQVPAALKSLDANELNDIYETCQFNIDADAELETISPILPQLNSGTRNFFLASIGNPTIGGCVNQTAQEHDPTPVDGNPLAIAPFSTARFVNNPPVPADPPSDITDIAAQAPTPGVFYVERDIFNVVRDTAVVTSDFQAIFGPTGFLCNRFRGNAGLLARQGFIEHPNCGTVVEP